jgi:pimeloyl-ACP methyl ester carboxylesterase
VSEQFARVNGIDICFETLGDDAGRPLLLVMGLGGPLIWWDDELCRLLVDRGFFVIRFDNRDCGRSTRIRFAPRPRPLNVMLGDKRSAAYTLTDMAADAAGLLDHLELPAAHVAGVSLGGMVGQTLAIRHPDRVLSLTSIMSTTGARTVGWPKASVMPVLTRRLPRTRPEYIDEVVRMWRVIGSPGYPVSEERIRRRAEATFDRGLNPAGTARQLVAVMASGDRTRALRGVRVPTLVIHGADDPLINVSGGIATRKAIRDAELQVVPGMGHDMPPALWPLFADGIDRTARRAEGEPAERKLSGASSLREHRGP